MVVEAVPPNRSAAGKSLFRPGSGNFSPARRGQKSVRPGKRLIVNTLMVPLQRVGRMRRKPNRELTLSNRDEGLKPAPLNREAAPNRLLSPLRDGYGQ